MRYKYDNKLIKCPLFVAETANSVKCEGSICKQQAYIFSSSSEKKKHVKRYCEMRYRECKNFKEVDEKYEKQF